LNKPCSLAIRPEHLALRKTSDGENVLPAKISELDFAGATTTIKVDSNGLALEALVLEPDGFAVGDECFVEVPADRISLIAE
jgi:ABC-type Fe3+/spermidine/putrescine transport system ATPase subunit